MRQLMLAAAVSGACAYCRLRHRSPSRHQIPGAGVYVGPGYDDGYYSEYGSRRAYGYRSYRYDDDGYHGRARGERTASLQRCGRYSCWGRQRASWSPPVTAPEPWQRNPSVGSAYHRI